GLLHEAREFLAEPAGDLVLVALAGLALRFLAGPAQARAEEAADVIGIVGDAEMPADQLSDAGGGPEVVRPAVGLGPLFQQAFHRSELAVGEAWRRAGVRPGRQATGTMFVGRQPAVERRAVDAENARNVRGSLALAVQLHGTAATAFEFSSGSKRSTHITLDAPGGKKVLWPRRIQ